MVHAKTLWVCNFCEAEFKYKDEAEEHAEGCIKNPVFYHCMSCGLSWGAVRLGGCADWGKCCIDKIYTMGYLGIADCKKHTRRAHEISRGSFKV